MKPLNFLHKLISNSALMLALFAMLLIPIGGMGLMVLKQDNVLSQEDIRLELTDPQVEVQDVLEATQSLPQTWQDIDN